MSYSYTTSETTTFTVTHARHLSAKVATDLKRMQRFYGSPSDSQIANFETEAVELLKAGYLGTVTYGFQRNGRWIEPTLQYTAHDLHASSGNDDPGKLRPGANIDSASFRSYLTYSAAWSALDSSQQAEFQASLPIQRVEALEPGVSGYFVEDLVYWAGGRALNRSSMRAY